MKKLTAILLTLILAIGTLGITALGADSGISVTIDGKAVSFDQPPVVINGRTLVPLRAIFEGLGAEVEWDAETKSIMATRGNTAALLYIDSTQMTYGTIGGTAQTITIDAPPTVINGRTLVPARAVAEVFDCKVNWDADSKSVIISTSNEITNNKITDAEKPVNEVKEIPKPVAAGSVEKSVTATNIDLNKPLIGKFAGTNAYIDNGIIYYGFIFQPYIFAYDGTNTQTYDTDSAPLGIVAQGDYIYYMENKSKAICKINKTSGEKTIIFSKMKNSDGFLIYRDKLIVSDASNARSIYAVDLSSGKSTLLYDATDKLEKVLNNDPKFYVKCNDNTLYFDYNYNYYTGRSVNDGEWLPEHNYYKVSLDDYSCTAIGERDFNKIPDADYASDWTYGSSSGSVYRESISSGTNETILSSNHYYYITNDDKNMVVLQAEPVKNGTPIATIGYSYGRLFVTDLNGDNMKEINSYKNGDSLPTLSGSNISLGRNNFETPSPQICGNCGGTGRVNCHLCGGTGRGPRMQMLGQTVYQGCAACGRAGWVVCGNCGGSGQQ